VKSSNRLLLFAVLFAVVAACAFHFSSYILGRSATGPVNYHYWIHSQLGLKERQESELEPIEVKFSERRDELIVSIRNANEELAKAIMADKGDSERVKEAVQKIHRAQGELQQAVLTPEQYSRLISLTAQALRESPESR
jgi:hypothetical protein